MNFIRPQRFVRIQLEQQIPHSFMVDQELIILSVMVLQLRALRPSHFIIPLPNHFKALSRSTSGSIEPCLALNAGKRRGAFRRKWGNFPTAHRTTLISFEADKCYLTGQPSFHLKQTPLFALNSRFLSAPDNPVQSGSRVAMYKKSLHELVTKYLQELARSCKMPSRTGFCCSELGTEIGVISFDTQQECVTKD